MKFHSSEVIYVRDWTWFGFENTQNFVPCLFCSCQAQISKLPVIRVLIFHGKLENSFRGREIDTRKHNNEFEGYDDKKQANEFRFVEVNSVSASHSIAWQFHTLYLTSFVSNAEQTTTRADLTVIRSIKALRIATKKWQFSTLPGKVFCKRRERKHQNRNKQNTQDCPKVKSTDDSYLKLTNVNAKLIIWELFEMFR